VYIIKTKCEVRKTTYCQDVVSCPSCVPGKVGINQKDENQKYFHKKEMLK
jgi:hypothetical protein